MDKQGGTFSMISRPELCCKGLRKATKAPTTSAMASKLAPRAKSEFRCWLWGIGPSESLGGWEPAWPLMSVGPSSLHLPTFGIARSQNKLFLGRKVRPATIEMHQLRWSDRAQSSKLSLQVQRFKRSRHGC